MRTTITFESDVAAAIERLRRERGEGVSHIVNELVRHALVAEPPTARFQQRTSSGHALIDVTDVAEALELLEGPGSR